MVYNCSWPGRRCAFGSNCFPKALRKSGGWLVASVRMTDRYPHPGWLGTGRTDWPVAEAGQRGVAVRRRCCWPSGSCQDLFRLAPSTGPWGRAGPAMRGLGTPAADVVAVQPWHALAALESLAPPAAARSSVPGTAAKQRPSACRSCQQGRCPCVHRRLGCQPAGLLASSC
ncbi:hypothetical protein D3C84_898120 [compost metagenome]